MAGGYAGGGGGGAPTGASYITQTPDATLSGEQALSALSTGLLGNTTGTGVLTALATPAYSYGNLISDTTAALGFRWCKQIISDDFFGFQNSSAASSGPFGFEAALVGAGAAISPAQATNVGRYGRMILNTGTTATGSAGVIGGGGSTAVYQDAILLGSDLMELLWVVKTGSALSDGTETYQVSAGFTDGAGAATLGIDAVAFRYTHSENAGNWVAYTRSNSVESVINTAVAVATSTIYELLAKVNAAGTSVEFFINGTSVGTISTNIPTTANRQTAVGANLVKSLGTTSRGFELERCVLVIG